MQFITTVLTVIFQAGVKELVECYVTKCMSFHMIYLTLKPQTPPPNPKPNPNKTHSPRLWFGWMLFALQYTLFVRCILLHVFLYGIFSHKHPGVLCCFVASDRRLLYKLPLVARIWTNFEDTAPPSFWYLDYLQVQNQNLHLPCYPCATCLSRSHSFLCFRVLCLL